MNSLYGIYTGIVIDNTGYDQPGSIDGMRFIGQVLVKINGITPAEFSEFYKAVPSGNVDGVLDIDTAKKTGILAYVMQPINGQSTQGLYDAQQNTTAATRRVASKQYTIMHNKLRDSFCDGPTAKLTPRNNPYGNNFFPNYPWNTGLGRYGIPEINTRVIVGFLRGSSSFPIILGKIPTQDEQESFYKKGGVFANAPGVNQNYGYVKPNNSNTSTTTGTTQDANAQINEATPQAATKPVYTVSVAGVEKTVNYDPYDLPDYLKKHPAYLESYYGNPAIKASGISADSIMNAEQRDFQQKLEEYRQAQNQDW